MSSLPPKKRIEFIDLAKGLCIILVVAYHCGILEPFPGAKQLRMPLYFVLSGLFFKDYGRDSLIKKINKLIIPFITFFIIGDLFYYSAHLLVNIPDTIKRFPVIDMLWGGVPCDMPIWFLLCLFNCYVIFLFITRFSKNNVQQFLLVSICSLIGFILSISDIKVLYFIDSALTSMPFFYFGYILKKSNILLPNKYDRFNILIAIALYTISFLIITWLPNNKINVFDNHVYGNLIIAYITSICLVLSVLYLCKAITRIPYISYIGRYSIVILLIHVPIMEIVYFILKYGLHTDSLLLKVIVTLLIASSLIPILIKYFPKITAQQDLITHESISRLLKSKSKNQANTHAS